MTTHTATAVMAVAVTSLAVAACGGGGGSGGGKSDREKSQEEYQEYALKQAECMRRHGVDVPDPKPNGALQTMDKQDVNPEEYERAERACENELGKPPPPPQLSEEEQREFREAALKHARCMRAHGIDFPDPTFDANGGARVTLKQHDPQEDPAFKAADAKCRKILERAEARARERSGG